MHHLDWTARSALPKFGSALTLSIVAHATGLLAWSGGYFDARPPLSVGLQQGAPLLVRIVPPTSDIPPKRSAFTPNPNRQAAPPRLAVATAAVKTKAPPIEVPGQITPNAPLAHQGTSAEPPLPPPPSPAQQPAGAQFASLFAPVIERPMGRGRWFSAPTKQPNPAPEVAMQREQALQSVRQALMDRIEQLKGHLLAHPLTSTCDIRIDLNQKWATIVCSDQNDQSQVWAYLNGLLMAAQTDATTTDACLRVEMTTVNWLPCQPA